MSKLVVINKTLTAMSHELGDKWVTIGRREGNAFQLHEPSVSGRHCEVRFGNGELTVRDLQSTNGTFVEGKRIIEGIVKSGQKLRLGEVELQLEVADAHKSSGAPANAKPSRVPLPQSVGPAAAKSAPDTQTGTKRRPAKPSEKSDSPEKKYQVLFVDDSLGFLESFTEICSVLSEQKWEIHSAASADRALSVLSHHAIDLVVLDLGIPMVDGIQLLGIIGRRYPGLKIAVLTGRASDANRATCLTGGAELFIEKPVSPESTQVAFNMLNDLISWMPREGFSGALKHVGLPEVIQMECNSRNSSILEIRNHQTIGQIYIESGSITHAAVGALAGEKAFNLLLALSGGEFRLRPFEPPPERTVQAGWEMMLLEAARCNDEETSLMTKKAEETAAQREAPSESSTPPDTDTTLSEDLVVVRTYDGKWRAANESKK